MSNPSKKSPFVAPQLSTEELTKALYETSTKLEKANQELVQTQEEQAAVFANISHDLRSPVTAIKNSVDYLLTSPNLNTADATETLGLMKRRIDYLEQLVNDVFLLSSLDCSEKLLRKERINVGMFLEDFFYSCDADKKYATRKLRFDVPVDYPYEADIDPKMFYRLLDNLFSNALKYSADGDEIALSSYKNSDNSITIVVSDTGIGIDDAHVKNIFNRTYMVESARTPGAFAGCGLGLSIVESIAKRHGGHVWCESVIKEGSRFGVVVPIAWPPGCFR